ncbi:MAG: acyl-CoA dehydratase activase [bacterium]|nr:acyl-CoA dehydratase activase [bacterium]
MRDLYIGIDIGSVSINVAVLDSRGLINQTPTVLKDWYVRIEGEPLKRTYDTLKLVFNSYHESEFAGMSATGRGGKLLSKILNIPFVNEILAHTISTGTLYPQVKSIIEIGGEDSKLILIEYDKNLGMHVIKDFAMNTICAAGTGSFLDQQAARIGIGIDEFSKLALTSIHPPRIAGRCSVFANTDMIHLQQEATPVNDIVAGLCFALARNFKSVIAKGKKVTKPVSFQGGVAANKGMVRAFKETFELSEVSYGKDGDLIIPTYFASMGAIGCALNQIKNAKLEIRNWKLEIEKIPEFLANRKEEHKGLPPLKEVRPKVIAHHWLQSTVLSDVGAYPSRTVTGRDSNTPLPVWLGIDVGSISTNVVLVDENKNIIARRYLWTAGRPIDAVLRGLKEIGEEVGNRVEVKGVGTTGSGRYMIGDLVGADVVKNEITAQARASIEVDPTVDTIFEIGGQDSKYISLQNGTILDFEMNKVCAAGTGSFLEEQAERLNLNIKDEFGKCALDSKSPIRLGERCTVFMQSDLTAWQQKGANREDLAAGLSYSIVYNYLNKVVGNKPIGDNIFFQGAVAHNKGVVAAFESVLNKPVTVPPHNDVTGAIGVAIIAMERMKDRIQESGDRIISKFKGFDLCKKRYNVESFECDKCPNSCEIKKVMLEGEEPLYYGSRCERYEKKLKVKSKKLKVDLFDIRNELLLKSYNPQHTAHDSQPVIGIPMSLIFHEYLPFWVTFFQELGCKVILSNATNRKIVHDGVEVVTSEHCFPVKACHGHILNLIEKKVDYIFIPSIISMQKEDHKIQESYTCPFEQAIPYVIDAALNPEAKEIKLIKPILYLKRGKKHIEEVMTKVGNKLGKGKSAVIHALNKADEAQSEFYKAIKLMGKDIIDSLEELAIVIVGRPYNTCDTGLNLNIPKILGDLGVLAIPMDFLSIEAIDIGNDWPNMYWRYGQQILSALRIIKQKPNLYPLYITNFGCGPDSFILKYFSKEMGKKPYLVIEVDEHSAPAGVITRCEAFLDSIENVPTSVRTEPAVQIFKTHRTDYNGRTLLIPFMGYHSYAVAAAFRHCKINAEVIPIADERSLELGRKYTTGKECFPCILTTGDMVKVLADLNFNPKSIAFFMPESCGPCRFGQYNKLQRIILSEMGYDNVPIVSPNQASKFYETLKEYGLNFDKIAWAGVCAVDVIDKLVRKTRPYEINKGETDRVYFKCLDLICKQIEAGRDVNKVMPAIRREFESVPINSDSIGTKPVIGVTGEIYVRSHHFSNDNLVRTIEELGGEVWQASTAEWFFYVNFRRKEDSVVNKNYKELITYWVTGKYLHWAEHRLQKRFLSQPYRDKKYNLNFEEPNIETLFRYSNPYLHQTVEGEAVLSVGKCIEFILKGASGIITVMPFTCMPGTNTAAVMATVKEQYGIPYLNMAYDGLEQSTAYTRLEAFMHQAHQYMIRNKS